MDHRPEVGDRPACDAARPIAVPETEEDAEFVLCAGFVQMKQRDKGLLLDSAFSGIGPPGDDTDDECDDANLDEWQSLETLNESTSTDTFISAVTEEEDPFLNSSSGTFPISGCDADILGWRSGAKASSAPESPTTYLNSPPHSRAWQLCEEKYFFISPEGVGFLSEGNQFVGETISGKKKRRRRKKKESRSPVDDIFTSLPASKFRVAVGATSRSNLSKSTQTSISIESAPTPSFCVDAKTQVEMGVKWCQRGKHFFIPAEISRNCCWVKDEGQPSDEEINICNCEEEVERLLSWGSQLVDSCGVDVAEYKTERELQDNIPLLTARILSRHGQLFGEEKPPHLKRTTATAVPESSMEEPDGCERLDESAAAEVPISSASTSPVQVAEHLFTRQRSSLATTPLPDWLDMEGWWSGVSPMADCVLRECREALADSDRAAEAEKYLENDRYILQVVLETAFRFLCDISVGVDDSEKGKVSDCPGADGSDNTRNIGENEGSVQDVERFPTTRQTTSVGVAANATAQTTTVITDTENEVFTGGETKHTAYGEVKTVAQGRVEDRVGERKWSIGNLEEQRVSDHCEGVENENYTGLLQERHVEDTLPADTELAEGLTFVDTVVLNVESGHGILTNETKNVNTQYEDALYSVNMVENYDDQGSDSELCERCRSDRSREDIQFLDIAHDVPRLDYLEEAETIDWLTPRHTLPTFAYYSSRGDPDTRGDVDRYHVTGGREAVALGDPETFVMHMARPDGVEYFEEPCNTEDVEFTRVANGQHMERNGHLAAEAIIIHEKAYEEDEHITTLEDMARESHPTGNYGEAPEVTTNYDRVSLINLVNSLTDHIIADSLESILQEDFAMDAWHRKRFTSGHARDSPPQLGDESSTPPDVARGLPSFWPNNPPFFHDILPKYAQGDSEQLQLLVAAEPEEADNKDLELQVSVPDEQEGYLRGEKQESGRTTEGGGEIMYIGESYLRGSITDKEKVMEDSSSVRQEHTFGGSQSSKEWIYGKSQSLSRCSEDDGYLEQEQLSPEASDSATPSCRRLASLDVRVPSTGEPVDVTLKFAFQTAGEHSPFLLATHEVNVRPPSAKLTRPSSTTTQHIQDTPPTM